MSFQSSRREFLSRLGISAAALPFVLNLSSLGWANAQARKKRLVILFSPNGVVPKSFWPDAAGEEFEFKEILAPLSEYQQSTLILKGVCDKVRGDGDNHMRGMGCLLTGTELFPGNIQGGSDTPAGWASGISIDQEIKNHLQGKEETRTRFGSLEFGVVVPDRADTWTRMVYAGPNKPIAPIGDPYQMFSKLYGNKKNESLLKSILDDVQEDLKKVSQIVSQEDRRLLEEHASFVREMESELDSRRQSKPNHLIPEIEPGVKESNDQIPKISRMQIDLMVSSFVADFARVASLQYTNSVGSARMRWLDIDESHHELSHEPDTNEEAQRKLVKINTWYCEQLAYLVRRLSETPEPNGIGSLLDNTTVVWTNELGKGNSHTLDNIPFVLVGGGLDFRLGRSIQYKNMYHNRLLLSIAHGMGHEIDTFGKPEFCKDGPLTDLTI